MKLHYSFLYVKRQPIKYSCAQRACKTILMVKISRDANLKKMCRRLKENEFTPLLSSYLYYQMSFNWENKGALFLNSLTESCVLNSMTLEELVMSY